MTENDVLVVTHPLAPASEGHVEALLNIISEFTTTALLTANLTEDSSIRENHEVIDISHEGVRDSIPLAAIQFLFNQLRMCQAVWSRDEKVILFFGSTSYLLPIGFARLLGRTVILEPRGNVPLTLRLQWEQRVPKPVARGLAGGVWALERVGYRLADAIITYTPTMATELNLKGFNRKLYSNGARYIDTEVFQPQTPYEERAAVVGFIGRLDEEKNVRMLADVARALPPNVTFRFIGDGELRAELEQALADEIDSGAVEFTGWVDHGEIPDEVSNLRLLVLPSEPTEGLPTVILEAMACGTPVLATPVSGVPDVIQDGETGFLFDGGNEEATAQMIVDILNRDDLTAISERARRLILDTYDFEAAVKRYQQILTSVHS